MSVINCIVYEQRIHLMNSTLEGDVDTERGREKSGGLFPLKFSVGSSFSYCTAVTGWRRSFTRKDKWARRGLEDRTGKEEEVPLCFQYWTMVPLEKEFKAVLAVIADGNLLRELLPSRTHDVCFIWWPARLFPKNVRTGHHLKNLFMEWTTLKD